MRTFPTSITVEDYDLGGLTAQEQLCEIIPKHQDMFKYGEFTIGQLKVHDGIYNIVGMNNSADNSYQSYLCFSYWGDVYLISCEGGGFDCRKVAME